MQLRLLPARPTGVVTALAVCAVCCMTPAAIGGSAHNRAGSARQETDSSRQQTTPFRVPHLTPNQVWVSSLPPGASVYLVEKPHRGSGGDSVGKTPLVVELDPARPVVVVELDSADFPKSIKLNQSAASRSQGGYFIDSSATYFVWKTTKFHPGKGEKRSSWGVGAEFEIDKKTRDLYVALFQPRDVGIDKVDALYPPGSNFEWSADDESIRGDLVEFGVSPKHVGKIAELLRRGGKIAVEDKGVTMTMEWTREATLITAYSKRAQR